LRGAFVTNIVKCNPKDIDGNNRAPSVEEIVACSEYFESEKRLVSPRVIISFGKTVTESLLSRRIANLSDLHGIPILQDGVTFLPMIHPSFVIRGAYDRRQYLKDFDIITDLDQQATTKVRTK
jgi:DNA polymerase